MSKLYSRAHTPPYPPPQTKFDRHSSSKSVPSSKGFISKPYSYREYDKYDKYSEFDKYDSSSKLKQDRYEKFDKIDNYKVDKELKDNLYDKYGRSSKGDLYDKYDKPLKGELYDKYEKPLKGDSYAKYDKSLKGDSYDKFNKPLKGDPYDKYAKPMKPDLYDKYDKPIKRESYDNYKPLKADPYEKYDKSIKDPYAKYAKPLKDDYYAKYDKPLKDNYDKYEKSAKSNIYEKDDRYVKSMEKLKGEKKYDSYSKVYRTGKDDVGIYGSTKRTYDRDEFQNFDTKKFPDKLKGRGEDTYREVSANYVKLKGNDNYLNQAYNGREQYPSKYSSKPSSDYSVYPSMESKSVSMKYQSRLGVEDFPDTSKHYNKFSGKSFSKYDSFDQNYSNQKIINEWYGDDQRPSYKNKNGSGYQASKGYSQESNTSNFDYQRETLGSSRTSEKYAPKKSSERLDRYVIGDSVVYGPPGQYPDNLYEKSPPPRRKKRISSPPMPPPPPIQPYSSSIKDYNRTSSPKRYGNERSSMRTSSPNAYKGRRKSPGKSLTKPPSPPPLPVGGFSRGDKSYLQSNEPKKSRDGYTDFDDIVENPKDRKSTSNGKHSRSSKEPKRKGELGVRDFPNKDKLRRPPLINKPPRSNYPNQSGSNRFESSYPGRSSPPKPLLSLDLPTAFQKRNDAFSPMSSNRVPIGKNRIHPRSNRMEGRIGQTGLANRRGLIGQDGMRNRRPTDLRAWIEFRKDSKAGQRQKLSPKRATRPIGVRPLKPRDTLLNRARNIDAPRRTLYKGRRIVGTSRGTLKRPLRMGALATKRKVRAGSSDSVPRKSKSYKSSSTYKVSHKDSSKSTSSRKDSSRKATDRSTTLRRRSSRSTSRSKRVSGGKILKRSKKVSDSGRSKGHSKSSSARSPSRDARRVKDKVSKSQKSSSSKRTPRSPKPSKSPRGPRSPRTPRTPPSLKSLSPSPNRGFIKSDRSESPDNDKNSSFTQLEEPMSIPMLDDRRRSSSPEKESF